MQLLLCLLLIFLAPCSNADLNLGHRLGGELHKPENTLYSLQKILPRKNEKNFRYLEMDVQESKDGYLVVFHDEAIKHAVPKTKTNIRNAGGSVEEFDRMTINKLSIRQIRALDLGDGHRIPTLKEVIDELVKLDYGKEKLLLIEPKYIKTDKARLILLNTIRDNAGKLDAHLFTDEDNFSINFFDKKRWGLELARRGIKVYTINKIKTDENNLAKDIANVDYGENTQYLTLIDNHNFYIKNGSHILEYPLRYKMQGVKDKKASLRLSIRQGHDNSGDGGLEFAIKDKDGKVLFQGKAFKKEWEMFDFPVNESGLFTLEISDQDTSDKRPFPGNGGNLIITEIRY